MDKLSYALGLSMGNNFLGSGIKSLNVEDFAKGIKAVYDGGKTEMTYDEAKTIINEFFTGLQKEVEEANLKEGQEFLAENAKRPNVVTLPSGLQYEILTEGKGRKPKATDRVQCHYHGTLINGQVFDSSIQRGEPAVFGVNQVIPGWVEALQLMPEGSRWKLYIPSDLAYGEQGAGQNIGPNTALIFEVELIKVL
ncbi:FKBP-type peptidyl-prolyl cis-trans isomerase [Barnesiella propionica]|uniref:FKBP-type peptidyl-prolyl cis-trans isomerase n=1 Tax=Barnesiella propionica TaxID=2981781 RepID=UPI0011CCC536|nr:FKBP-type peptidyl-prolyl cis-trans isomerase [Barnesiella propionica]MCU6768932.1 FKBP-type peptidyl-prolyl cis-trans isomerase [Barnesiella propionica]